MDKRYSIICKNEVSNDASLQVSLDSDKRSGREDLTVGFSLVHASEIKVSLLNMMGKVEYFVKNRYDEGINSIKFCTREFKKGLYFLELIADGKVSMMRVLIR
ncbi:MAG: T9SS type A sorting domain-containing protein [Cytophagaceae bacterium]